MQQSSIIVNKCGGFWKLGCYCIGKMGVQFAVPDELHSKHTIDDPILVYSQYQTTFLSLLHAKLLFHEMVPVFQWEWIYQTLHSGQKC